MVIVRVSICLLFFHSEGHAATVVIVTRAELINHGDYTHRHFFRSRIRHYTPRVAKNEVGALTRGQFSASWRRSRVARENYSR